MQCLWVPGQLPGYNELFGASSRHWAEAHRIKSSAKQRVGVRILEQRLAVIEPGSYFTYLFVCGNRRHDPSNVISGGIKVIEDALQSAGMLANDGWEHVAGIGAFVVHESFLDVSAGSFLTIDPVRCRSLATVTARLLQHLSERRTG